MVQEFAEDGKFLSREESRSAITENCAADTEFRHAGGIDQQHQRRRLSEPGAKFFFLDLGLDDNAGSAEEEAEFQ